MQNSCSRYGAATVLALVALRLVIGWHFFSEGSAHLADPRWTAEGFLRASKGPLAPQFQSVLVPPGFGFDDTIHVADASKDNSGELIDAWRDRVIDGLQAAKQQFVDLFKPSPEQKAEMEKVLERRKRQFLGWLDDKRDDHGSTREDLANHIHDWQRLAWARKSPSADNLPFEKKRIADAQAKLKSQAGPWTGQVRAIEAGMLDEFDALLSDEQRAAGLALRPSSTLQRLNRYMAWGITIVGGCLLVGLLARLAALVGAGFLLSVVLSQPPWLSDTIATYPQLLEMLALVALATVPVGRWAGLDFFLQFLFRRPCCSAKGKSDATHS